MGACRESWESEPIVDARPLPFSASYSAAEFDRIRQGLVPEVMEDKWFVYFEEPSLFLHRSWTGQGVYRVDFEAHDSGFRVSGAVCAASILASGGAAYQAQLLDFLISNLLLGRGVPFPKPEGLKETMPGLFQHAVSGTGQREVSARRRRPWWRFWR
ncbi:hypothetical protein ACO2Q3_07380 [Caulobacter sp. KR2-114]|uniref:hypothetical protein n=1 Tax=Caulobacter sp. KR2-114 TaxID=3400912 RepID=UPI003C070442